MLLVNSSSSPISARKVASTRDGTNDIVSTLRTQRTSSVAGLPSRRSARTATVKMKSDTAIGGLRDLLLEGKRVTFITGAGLSGTSTHAVFSVRSSLSCPVMT